jgi:hypothetical protein
MSLLFSLSFCVFSVPKTPNTWTVSSGGGACVGPPFYSSSSLASSFYLIDRFLLSNHTAFKGGFKGSDLSSGSRFVERFLSCEFGGTGSCCVGGGVGRGCWLGWLCGGCRVWRQVCDASNYKGAGIKIVFGRPDSLLIFLSWIPNLLGLTFGLLAMYFLTFSRYSLFRFRSSCGGLVGVCCFVAWSGTVAGKLGFSH